MTSFTIASHMLQLTESNLLINVAFSSHLGRTLIRRRSAENDVSDVFLHHVHLTPIISTDEKKKIIIKKIKQTGTAKTGFARSS